MLFFTIDKTFGSQYNINTREEKIIFGRDDGYGHDDDQVKVSKKRNNDSMTARYCNKDDDDSVALKDDGVSLTSRYLNKD